MGERYPEARAADDDNGSPQQAPITGAPGQDYLPIGQSLLQQTIVQLERLRQDYRQFRTLVQKLGQQLAQREAQASANLRRAMALLDRASQPTTGAARPDPPHAAVLVVYTLGSFAVHWGDQELSLGNSRKGRAIFRYLVTHPQKRASKEALLELFWPDEKPDRAGHKLHIAVSTLRQGLAQDAKVADSPPEGADPAPGLLDNCIVFEDEHYGLHPDIDVQLDIDELVSHYGEGERLERQGLLPEAVQAYEKAASLYGGDYLTEDLYADWAIAMRARLEETYLTLLGRLANAYFQQGRYGESVSRCRQILARDSFREDAYRQIMRCYSRMGQRNQALLEFGACTEVLQRELGVRPMQETIDLYELILNEKEV